MHRSISLHRLARGQFGTINRLDGTADQVHRIQELGLRSGVRVEMVQPGSPCIVRINEAQKFCVRKSKTMGIFVLPAGA
ncbi:MAG: ferrous iron transport protein A [Pirellulaceae bacterium]